LVAFFLVILAGLAERLDAVEEAVERYKRAFIVIIVLLKGDTSLYAQRAYKWVVGCRCLRHLHEAEAHTSTLPHEQMPLQQLPQELYT